MDDILKFTLVSIIPPHMIYASQSISIKFYTDFLLLHIISSPLNSYNSMILQQNTLETDSEQTEMKSVLDRASEEHKKRVKQVCTYVRTYVHKKCYKIRSMCTNRIMLKHSFLSA